MHHLILGCFIRISTGYLNPSLAENLLSSVDININYTSQLFDNEHFSHFPAWIYRDWSYNYVVEMFLWGENVSLNLKKSRLRSPDLFYPFPTSIPPQSRVQDAFLLIYFLSCERFSGRCVKGSLSRWMLFCLGKYWNGMDAVQPWQTLACAEAEISLKASFRYWNSTGLSEYPVQYVSNDLWNKNAF